MARTIPLPHPGEVLKTEFLDPMELSTYAVAKAIGLSRSRLNDIVRGRQGVTANVAVRLGKFFGVDPQWFMNMQAKYDLEQAAQSLSEVLADIEPHRAA